LVVPTDVVPLRISLQLREVLSFNFIEGTANAQAEESTSGEGTPR
jgi:hypothetical protein